MILTILGVSIILSIIMAIVGDKTCDEWPTTVLVIGVIMFFISFIATIVLSIGYSNNRIIDKKITIYQEENQHIEEQIQAVVDNYMQYESETFDKITGDGDPITLVTLYPELKSNELVARQIEVYQENNQQIKELRCEKLDHQIEAWWLFFGGGE